MMTFRIPKMYNIRTTLFLLTAIIYLIEPTDSGAVQLTEQNLDNVLASNELVFINFYADWCRFSNLLMPIFDETAEAIAKEFPEAGKVVIGKVDCDKESSISSKYHITKYPTLKVIRNGQPAKREYRGQRSVEAFTTFIKKQLEDPVKEFKQLKELGELESEKRIIIGYFDRRDQPQYSILRRVATNLKDDCDFHVGFAEASQQMHPAGQPIIVFRPDKIRTNDRDETYPGGFTNFDELHNWALEKCVPLVREITFENAEELTEEGLPFLILFHAPDDKDSIRTFNQIVLTELYSEKSSINFLTADGKKFAHPLHHLGKSEKDLPLIAIDSFRHMYLFPNYQDINVPNKLKQFLKDLYSGKLHREFHYGPDSDSNTEQQQTTPPDSTFKKLAPSKNRYTLLGRDEL
ncbi:endoplasmic reticulum resident protein 44-like [Diabrotica virgifera virgifera]|uniref:Thioredoxin domain-containing protein n=1 Tax=Diabrotica virgifera virgifera TaxID=50390 RepID=A0ABM5JZ48_DIAVI|nr:endoplasmic reticulum resident protein 44-like [Diabrotica virgifera virgifera]